MMLQSILKSGYKALMISMIYSITAYALKKVITETGYERMEGTQQNKFWFAKTVLTKVLGLLSYIALFLIELMQDCSFYGQMKPSTGKTVASIIAVIFLVGYVTLQIVVCLMLFKRSLLLKNAFSTSVVRTESL